MRRVLGRILKIVAGAILLAGICFYVVLNHSTLTQELTCKGHWQRVRDTEQVAEVAHVQLTEYRWWVHLWAESDGNVAMQTEKLALASYLGFVHKIGEGSLSLYEFRDSK